MAGPTTVAQVVELLDEYVYIAADEFREVRNALELLALRITELEEKLRGLDKSN